MALLVACGGVKEEDLDGANARIELLKSKGVPDNKLSDARIRLYSAREHQSKNNGAQAKKAMDSSMVFLAEAEKFYNEQVATLGPKIDASLKTARDAKASLTGFQVKKIDSIAGVVDSFKKIQWLLQADNVATELVALLPALREDEQKSNSIRRRVPGQWVFEDRAKSVEHKEVNALTRKVFHFQPNNRVYLVESKKGQSGPYLREDWEFRSWGTYDFKGDTIMLIINRFQSFKQDFHRIHMVDGKPVWKHEPQPVYDSAITDGSQDRSITWADLTEDFKRR